MPADQEVIIGIDGGGTRTRILVTDLSGNVLSYVEKGAASFHKDIHAADNVRLALLDSLKEAGKEPHQVKAVAAGIAGYDTESDMAWVEQLTEVEGLHCPKWHVNDAIVAHYGALLAKPGIIAISGTGSIILARLEDGSFVRNYDFRHYAASAARLLAYDAAFEVLAGHTDDSDSELVAQLLRHWGVQSFREFLQLGRSGFLEDRRERDRKFGQFAPALTRAASRDSALAKRVCDRAVGQLKTGIELLAALLELDAIPVALIGSVLNSHYFAHHLSEQLQSGSSKTFSVVKPHFSPVTGSVLLAMERLQLTLDESTICNLQKH